MKLVLFDIDGTILLTDGAAKRAFNRALVEVFGATGPANHSFGGKTDPQIARELMRLAGFADDHIDARLARLFDLYLRYLDEELRAGANGIRVMPGVHELLDALEARADAIVGLLTGNIAAGARAKLTSAGIDPDRFVIGAFGSDHEQRGELPAVAQRRARERLGVEVTGADVIVIGDTPADIHCGRGVGARAIAVATGFFTLDQLREHAPAALFSDLSPTAEVIRAIFLEETATAHSVIP